MHHNQLPSYRPDIDGLRAIAVLSVVAFHAFPEIVRGGFVGVDIFFVISGFLISTIILKSLDGGEFSFGDFYVRRIKRIFPALILVLVSCFAFGWFALISPEYKQLGKHIGGGAAFISNLVLWNEAGYFDTAAEAKPLLHLWSLGIEEQFYFAWPLMLYLAYRLRRNALSLILVGTALSFVANVITISSDAVAAFFLPHTRFWELLLGSVLAWITLHRHDAFDAALRRFLPAANPNALQDLKSIIGVGLITLAVLLIDRDRAFPGWWALLPTLGAFLVISAGAGAVLNRRVLAHPALVFIGLISYPLYLWHWPLLAFARIIETGMPSVGIRATLVAVSVLLAFLTYRLFERPVRRSTTLAIPIGLFITCAIIGGIGYNAYLRDGLAFRMKRLIESQKDIADFERYREAYAACSGPNIPPEGFSWCIQSKPGKIDFALFGDSHADHLFPGIAENDKAHNWLLIGQSACPPLADMQVHKASNKDLCRSRNAAALDMLIKNRDITRVVLASLGPFYISDTGFAPAHQGKNDPRHWRIESSVPGDPVGDKPALFRLGMQRTIDALQAAGKAVDVYIDVPELAFNPSDCLMKRPFARHKVQCRIDRAVVEARQRPYRKLMADLRAANPDVRFFDPLMHLCNDEYCNILRDDTLYYRDSHHLSLRGSDFLAHPFLAWFGEPKK